MSDSSYMFGQWAADDDGEASESARAEYEQQARIEEERQSDSSLREALEKLAASYQKLGASYPSCGPEDVAEDLRALLAAHPAGSGTPVADESVGTRPQPTLCTCDPGPEGQHRYWCATYGPHNCTEHRVTALDGEGQSLGYTHCGICGEPEQTEEERGFVEIALAAVDAGNAGSWPTVAGYLADEVRRLRSEAVRPLPTRERIEERLAQAMADSWMGDEVDCADVGSILAPAMLALFSGGEE